MIQMSNTPTLLRTSTPSAEGLTVTRITELANRFTQRELAAVLQRSTRTAARRQAGFGWTVHETLLLAVALRIAPSDMFVSVEVAP